jgi:hypothetical protein
MQNVAKTTAEAVETDGKKSLTERAVSELEKYAVISRGWGTSRFRRSKTRFWILFALFSLHRQLLQAHGISLWQQGFAIVNALVFGKVILIGEALELGRGKASYPLAWVVLRKSLIFAILLVAFHILEEAIRAWFEGQPTSAAVNGLGGSMAGVVAYAAIFFVMLIPFYAFQETGRILGNGALWNLFLHSGEKRFRLIED